MTRSSTDDLNLFHFDAPEFIQRAGTWAWLAVYVAVPPIMMIVLWVQLRDPGSDPIRLRSLSRALRVVLAGVGVALIAGGVMLLVDPVAESWMWPWLLTPLTGRAVGAWLVGFGLAMAHFAWESDWDRIRPATASVGMLGILQLITVLRYLDVPAWDTPQTWVYMSVLIGFIALGGWGWHIGRIDSGHR